MSANPKIQSVKGVPTGDVPVDQKLPLTVELKNMGDEGDVYLSCFCSSASHTGVPPYDMGTRLENWKPAGSGQLLIYSGVRGLIAKTDPASFGLCGGCHPDGDCWPDPLGLTTLRFETGYLASGAIVPTDSITMTPFTVVSEAGRRISWPLIAAGIGGITVVSGLAFLIAKKR